MDMPKGPNRDGSARPAAEPRSSASGARGLAFKLAALVLVVVSGVAGTGLARWLKAPKPEATPEKTATTNPLDRVFRGWDKPDLLLVLSAQQHGYVLPCGCSEPQIGGLERRYNFMQLVRERGWPIVAVDLGDVAQRNGPVQLPNLQGLIKYRYSMKALKEMGYTAVGLGENEGTLSLFSVLGEFALNDKPPVVLAGNLANLENFPGALDYTVEKAPGTAIRVGVTSTIGPTVAKKIKDPAVQFTPTRAALNKVLQAMDGQTDLRVLLYHGEGHQKKADQLPEAVACAKAFPQFQVVLCLSEEDEPPANPTIVDQPGGQGQTFVLSLGHKGKYVGALGVYRTNNPAQPYTFRYQLAEMGPEYATPRDQEAGHPIMKLMEAYTHELKADNYLGRYGQTKHVLQAMPPVEGLRNPGNPTYVGSEVCKKCHDAAYDVWKKTPHHHAYDTLVTKAKHPSLRQFDAECIVCHTVGFGYQGGFVDAEKTPHLENVGCESCHGPASLHVKNPNDKEWQTRMNLQWKAPSDETAKQKTDRMGRIDQFCQRCHDIDNDVTWKHNAFQRKWPKIAHYTDPEAAGLVPAPQNAKDR
jgi:hypothetical protein